MYCDYRVADKYTVVETKCPMCGATNRLVMDERQFGEYRIAAENNGCGMKVQEIFPTWTPEEREKLLTGYCSECQKKIFANPFEDEEDEEEPRKEHKMKLTSQDTTMDLMLKMSEGNPGALTVCAELFKLGTPGVVALINLDDIGLYGERLYMLWNDCCNRDVEKVMKVVKARNFGKFTSQDIRDRVAGVRGKPYTDEELEVDDSDDSND